MSIAASDQNVQWTQTDAICPLIYSDPWTEMDCFLINITQLGDRPHSSQLCEHPLHWFITWTTVLHYMIVMFLSLGWKLMLSSAAAAILDVLGSMYSFLILWLGFSGSILWTLRRWAARLPELENWRPQTWHLYGFSPVCTRMWSLRPRIRVNAASHWVHLNGLMPAWVRRWAFKTVLSWYLIPQTSQQKGRSPLWYSICWLRWWRSRNVLVQRGQENCPGELCRFRCISRRLTDLLHKWHTFQVQRRRCLFICCLCSNVIPHVSHTSDSNSAFLFSLSTLLALSFWLTSETQSSSAWTKSLNVPTWVPLCINFFPLPLLEAGWDFCLPALSSWPAPVSDSPARIESLVLTRTSLFVNFFFWPLLVWDCALAVLLAARGARASGSSTEGCWVVMWFNTDILDDSFLPHTTQTSEISGYFLRRLLPTSCERDGGTDSKALCSSDWLATSPPLCCCESDKSFWQCKARCEHLFCLPAPLDARCCWIFTSAFWACISFPNVGSSLKVCSQWACICWLLSTCRYSLSFLDKVILWVGHSFWLLSIVAKPLSCKEHSSCVIHSERPKRNGKKECKYD